MIDEKGFFKSQLSNPAIVILSNSPKINLEKALLYYKPKMVIADGSNYKSFKKRWSKTCDSYKVRYHDTSIEGAFRQSNFSGFEL